MSVHPRRGVKPRPHSNTKEARNQAWERRKQKQQTHTHGESNARPPSTTASTPWRKPHSQLGLLCTNLQGSDDCILVFLNSLMGKLGCGQQTHALQCKIPGRHTNIPEDMYTQAKKCSLRHVHIKKHLQRIYVHIKQNKNKKICKDMYAGRHVLTHKETSPRCVDRKSNIPIDIHIKAHYQRHIHTSCTHKWLSLKTCRHARNKNNCKDTYKHTHRQILTDMYTQTAKDPYRYVCIDKHPNRYVHADGETFPQICTFKRSTKHSNQLDSNRLRTGRKTPITYQLPAHKWTLWWQAVSTIETLHYFTSTIWKKNQISTLGTLTMPSAVTEAAKWAQ